MFGESSGQGIMLMAATELFALIKQKQLQHKEKRMYKVEVQFIEVYPPPPCTRMRQRKTATLHTSTRICMSRNTSHMHPHIHARQLLSPPFTCSYQDELRDLLNPSKTAARPAIRCDDDKGIIVDGALKLPAASAADVADAISDGLKRRVVGSTSRPLPSMHTIYCSRRLVHSRKPPMVFYNT